LRYLGIIIADKFRFSEHIRNTAARSVKLIHSLSKSAKLTWGLDHKALQTIYKDAILPLLLHGAPVWIEAMRYKHNRLKYIRVQRLMNIKIAKAFCTTSSEALCISAVITPIVIRREEAAKQYTFKKGKEDQTQSIYREVELKNWPHPADALKIIEVNDYEDQTIQIYTDGSKQEHGVRSGVAIYIGNELATQVKYKLDNRCSNNQTEQLAIAKALEAIQTMYIKENTPRIVVIFTDSRISLDSINNANNQLPSRRNQEKANKITGIHGSRPTQVYMGTNRLIDWQKQRRRPATLLTPTKEYH
jgi:ribonuclease HI